MNKIRDRMKKIYFITVVFFAILFIIDMRLRPIIKEAIANKAQVMSTHAINDAVLQELDDSNIKYLDLVTIEKSDNGRIIALTTNSQLINRLKAKISVAIQNKLSESDVNKIKMPISSLLGSEFFSGWGPFIPLKISISGSVITEFTSDFCDAGINQTKHQIYINIHTMIGALVPGYTATTNVDTNMTVAETIIVGDVPNVYASGGVGQMSEASHLQHMGK